MVVNGKPTGRALSTPAGLAVGVLTALALTVGGSALLAKLMEMELMPEEKIGYGVMVLLILSSFFGAKMSWNKLRRRKMMFCLLTGCIYMGTLLLITALFFGGNYSGVKETALLVFCGSGLAAFSLFSNKRRAGEGIIRIPNG